MAGKFFSSGVLLAYKEKHCPMELVFYDNNHYTKLRDSVLIALVLFPQIISYGNYLVMLIIGLYQWHDAHTEFRENSSMIVLS
jgi:hypothetical protein